MPKIRDLSRRERAAARIPGTRLSTRWRELFIEKLAETSNVTKAAEFAGFRDTRVVYMHRRREPRFAAEWLEALAEGYGHLEMEVLRRLREGDFHVGEGDSRSKYDFAAAIRTLQAHSAAVAHQRAMQDDEDEAAVIASLDAKLDAIRAGERTMKALLAEDGVAAQVDGHDPD